MNAESAFVFVAAFLSGVVLGYVGHEIAHWLVLRAGGFDAGLSLWPPHAAVETPEPVPWLVRGAAVAPALVGFCVAASGFYAGGVWWVAGVGAASRLCHLSAADIHLARGSRRN